MSSAPPRPCTVLFLLLCCAAARGATIHEAAANGDLALVDELLKQHVRIDARDENGDTPLHWAARGERATVVTIRELIARGATVDAYDFAGFTPLMVAAAEGDAARLRALIAAGADLDLRTNARESPDLPYGMAGRETALMLAVDGGHADRVAALLDAGAEVSLNAFGGTALHRAAARADGHAMVRLLLEARADPEAVDGWGRTPLMAAALSGDPESVQILIQSGADLFRRDRRGRTALQEATPGMLARSRGSSVWRCCVALLEEYRIHLEATSDPARARTPEGLDLLMATAGGGGRLEDVWAALDAGADVRAVDERGASVMWWVALRRDPDAPQIVETLAEAGADLDRRGAFGHPPILAAARYGVKEVMAALIEAGADVDGSHTRGVTALIACAARADPTKIDLLIGAKALVHARTADGRTALWFACGAPASGAAALKRLLEAGASIEARDKNGMGPLMVAASGRGDLERIEMLLARGAAVNDVDATAFTVLAVAVASGCPVAHVDALIDAGALIGETEPPRTTALMVSAARGDAEMTEHLLKRGAAVATVDGRGRTALHHMLALFDCTHMLAHRSFDPLFPDAATESREFTEVVRDPSFFTAINDEVVELLVGAGADANARDDGGVTPLMLAAQYADAAIVRRLLAAGAAPDARDDEGRTALDRARARKREGATEVRRLLEGAAESKRRIE